MHRNKATDIINKTLGPSCEILIMEDLKSNYFSLIVDKSTDIKSKKSLVILARYFKNDHVRDVFVKLVEVQDATVEGLFKTIKTFSILIKYHMQTSLVLGWTMQVP